MAYIDDEERREYQRRWLRARRAEASVGPDGTRECARCKERKPLTFEFFYIGGSGKYKATCRTCQHKRQYELDRIKKLNTAPPPPTPPKREGPPLPAAFDTGFPAWLALSVPVALHERIQARRVNWIVPVAEEVEA